MIISDKIKQLAEELGFDACAIASPEIPQADAEYMSKWLVEGHHAKMTYLENNFAKRMDPKLLVPGCKSVVVVLLNYFPQQQALPSGLKIAKYAYSEIDYHRVMKVKLEMLEKSLCDLFGADIVNNEVQHTFVDSAPLLERRLAQQAGLGWIGRNTLLINPDFGSFCFIGSLLLSVEIGADKPINPRCGTCRKCIEACPVGALTDNGLCAGKCIAYLSIEDRLPSPANDFGYLAGCDICADVCPWNKKLARPHTHPELLEVRDEQGVAISQWKSGDWYGLNRGKYNSLFKRSALSRLGFQKLKTQIQNHEEYRNAQ